MCIQLFPEILHLQIVFLSQRKSSDAHVEWFHGVSCFPEQIILAGDVNWICSMYHSAPARLHAHSLSISTPAVWGNILTRLFSPNMLMRHISSSPPFLHIHLPSYVIWLTEDMDVSSPAETVLPHVYISGDARSHQDLVIILENAQISVSEDRFSYHSLLVVLSWLSHLLKNTRRVHVSF